MKYYSIWPVTLDVVSLDSFFVFQVYLIDTVLNIKDEHSADRLWIPGDRDGTAICYLSNEKNGPVVNLGRIYGDEIYYPVM